MQHAMSITTIIITAITYVKGENSVNAVFKSTFVIEDALITMSSANLSGVNSHQLSTVS